MLTEPPDTSLLVDCVLGAAVVVGLLAVEADTGLTSLQFNNGNSNVWSGSLSVQYSIPYLQSQVKDVGLHGFLGHLIPLVEITWASRASAPSQQPTTWTVAPGVIYIADLYQVGIEALIPVNEAAGTNVGVAALFHLFLDDLLPHSLGKPIF